MYSMYAITEFHIQHTDIRAATYKAFCFLPSSVNQIRFCPSCSFHTFTMLQWLSVVTLAIKQKRWTVKCRHTVKVGAVSFCFHRRQKLVFAAEVKFVKCFRVSELCCTERLYSELHKQGSSQTLDMSSKGGLKKTKHGLHLLKAFSCLSLIFPKLWQWLLYNFKDLQYRLWTGGS